MLCSSRDFILSTFDVVILKLKYSSIVNRSNSMIINHTIPEVIDLNSLPLITCVPMIAAACMKNSTHKECVDN